MASTLIRVSQSVQGSISANLVPLGRHMGDTTPEEGELSTEVRVLTLTRLELWMYVWKLSLNSVVSCVQVMIWTFVSQIMDYVRDQGLVLPRTLDPRFSSASHSLSTATVGFKF